MSDASEFRTGWRVAAAGFLIGGCAVSSLPFFTMGVFTKPLAEAFGWSRGETQGFLTCLTFGVFLGSPLIGWMADRFGLRPVTMLSISWLATGLAALALFTNSLTSFYVIAFVTAVIGAGTTSVTYSRAIISWFERHRGLALGIAISGPGAWSVFGPSYITWLIEHYGWRAGYLGLAIMPMILALPAAIFWLRMRPLPAAAVTGVPVVAEPGMTFREAATGYRFWCIGVGFFLFCFGTGGSIPHMIPMLTDRGLSGQDAARIAGISGMAVLVGRIGGGWLLDRFWAPAVAAVVVGTPAVFCLALAQGGAGEVLTTAAALSIGLAAGAEFDIVAYLVSRYFGMRNYGLIYGVLYGMFVSATGVSPPLFGWMFDSHGNYDLALTCAGLAFGAGALIVLMLGKYPKLTGAK